MQVIDNRDHEQKEVLIGQRGDAISASVVQDANLMGMLSTGLYSFPLRTMIQEILFNAKDAHRMGNCEDKPFEVVINDKSGLIIKDFGPGISPEMIGLIYLTYGNSTKRDDDGSTGGFGLGSKSPFGYTESFMVQSCHEGKRSMYTIMKACEDLDGLPGAIPLVKDIDCGDETGLTVTIPLQKGHHVTAQSYIEDLAHFSGLKFKFTYDMSEEGVYEEKDYNETSIEHGEFVVDFDNVRSGTHNRLSRINAVMGGVSYVLEENEEYAEEFQFLTRLTSELGGPIYIGFAPSTLTPAPSREALIYSGKTKETVKSVLENIYGEFRESIEPMVRGAMHDTLQEMKDADIPAYSAMLYFISSTQPNLCGIFDMIYEDKPEKDAPFGVSNGYNRYALNRNRYRNDDRRVSAKMLAEQKALEKWNSSIFKQYREDVPTDAVSDNILKSFLYLAYSGTANLCSLVGASYTNNLVKSFYRVYGDAKLAREIYLSLGRQLSFFGSYSTEGNQQDRINKLRLNATSDKELKARRKVISLKDQFEAKYVKNVQIRMFRCSDYRVAGGWSIVSNIRGAGRVRLPRFYDKEKNDHVRSLRFQHKIQKPETPYSSKLWSSKSGEEVRDPVSDRYLVISRSIGDLDRLGDPHYLPFGGKRVNSRLANTINGRFNGTPDWESIVSVVVKCKEDDFQKAIQDAKDAGYIVCEAPKAPVIPKEDVSSLGLPAKPVAPKKKRVLPKDVLWDRVAPYFNSWTRHLDKVASPKVYIHLTNADFDFYGADPKPSKDIAEWVVTQTDNKFVVLETKQKEVTIRKAGALSFAEYMDKQVDNLLKNPDRFLRYYAFSVLVEEGNFPPEVSFNPTFQKAMGIKNYIRSSELPTVKKYATLISFFAQELKKYKHSRCEQCWDSTYGKMHNAFERAELSEEMQVIRKLCKDSLIFDPEVLLKKVQVTKKGRNAKHLMEKLVRFLKTV